MGFLVASFLAFLIVISALVTIGSLVGLGVGIWSLIASDATTGAALIVNGLLFGVIGAGATLYWVQELNEPAHN